MIKRLSLLILVILLQQTGICQQVSFSHLSVNDGLFTNFVNSICQDKKGFLWIGTENGLQRYDGNTFVHINSANLNRRLPGLPVNQLIADTQTNYIWVRMGLSVGKFYTDKGDFIPASISLKRMPNGSVPVSLHLDSRRHAILVIGSAGVYVYNDKTNTFEENPSVVNVPENFTINNIFEDKEKHWFYVYGKEGIQVYNPATREFYTAQYNPYHLPELELTKNLDYVRWVYIDSRKRCWIQTWPPQSTQNLYLLKSNNLQLLPVEPDMKDYYEIYSVQENEDMVWCFGLNMLNLYDEYEAFFKFYRKNNPDTDINFSVVKQLFEDRDKNIWLVTDNGLYQLMISVNTTRVGYLSSLHGATFTTINTLSDNKIICGSWGKGISIFSLQKGPTAIITDSILVRNIYKNAPHVNPDFFGAWSIVNDTDRHLIVIGCQAGKIIKYNTLSRQSKFLVPKEFEGSTVRQVIKDRYGDYWYGLNSGKVFKEHDNRFLPVKDYHKAFITKLYFDDNGLLWIATAGFGLQVINPVTYQTVRSYNQDKNNPVSLASNEVADVLQYNDSLFVLVLVKNLDILNTKKNTLKHITTNEGLPNNTIYAVVKDARQNLWMSTNDGIVKYIPLKNEFQSFTKKDGLITVVNNEDLLYTGCLLPDNFIMFGGEKSKYLLFNPDSVGNSSIPKNVAITDIRLFNTFLPVDSIISSGGIHFSHTQNTITINFTSFSYSSDNTLTYYYRLLGASDVWLRAQKPYSAAFNSLPPGNYTFQVKCVNTNGDQSPQVTSLVINIARPYWQTWWFILLMIILAFIPVYIIYMLRKRRVEAVQKIREKVARDLHDDVGSTLTSINILSEISRNKIKDDNDEVKDYLNRISNTSSQMMDAMDDIVWNIKPANDTMEKIEARMREYAAAVFEPKDILYRFIDNEKIKSISLNMDVRRSLFLIFKETLNNIAKYANASLVTVQFELKNAELLLTIIDDGVGFDEAKVTYGNGIENMQKRAKSFRGSYNIKSYPGKGTHVLLSIPLSKYYT